MGYYPTHLEGWYLDVGRHGKELKGHPEVFHLSHLGHGYGQHVLPFWYGAIDEPYVSIG